MRCVKLEIKEISYNSHVTSMGRITYSNLTFLLNNVTLTACAASTSISYRMHSLELARIT